MGHHRKQALQTFKCLNISRFSDVRSTRFCILDWIRELELVLIQTQMTQKPVLRAEVYARALRASQNRKEDSV